MVKRWNIKRLLTAAVAIALTTGCGGGTLETEGDPTMNLTVDDKAAPTGSTCTNFQPDTTRGQTKYHKSIKIRNVSTSATSKQLPLCVAWTVQDTNSQLKITQPSSVPSDATCKATDKAGIASNSSGISFDIEYAPNESGDDEPIKITFTTNDPAHPTVTLCFGIAKVGAIAVLEPSQCNFTNVTAANPQSCCFKLLNSGNASLTFKGAGIEPSNSQYAIVKQPNSDELIAGKGSPENPDGSKYLEVCVRYTPDSSEGNEKATLVVATNAQPSEVKAAMDATTEAQATFNINCTEATGKKIFSFPDPIKASAKCKICGEGPPPLKLQNLAVVAYTQQQQTDADSTYKVGLYDIAGNKQAILALAKDKCADIVVDYAPPSGGAGPAAYVSFTYTSANVSNKGSIPIVAGSCDAGQPDFGPATVRAQAAVGGTWTTTLSLANQSCGGLTITNVCPYDGTYLGKDQCADGAKSKHFSLTKGFATTTLPGFGLATVDLEFKPANGNKKIVNDALAVQYCPGTYASGQCSAELVTRVLSLVGTVEFESTPKVPTAEISIATPAANILAGKQVALQLATKDLGGFQPDATMFYWWTVTKRPEGSTTWLAGDDQGSDSSPVMDVIPDLAGEYEISGQIQAISASGTDAYSPQVKVTFTAN